MSSAKFDPVEFYRQALRWNSRNSSEVTSRSVASRAYYGAFLPTRESLSAQERTSIGSSGDTHRNLVDCVMRRGDAASIGIGNDLRDLRRLRNMADYDLNQFDTMTAGKAVNLSL